MPGSLEEAGRNKTMTPPHRLKVLRKIVTRLQDSPVDWVVTGSLGMALQGVPVEVHDVAAFAISYPT
jgi:hypothetical protein